MQNDLGDRTGTWTVLKEKRCVSHEWDDDVQGDKWRDSSRCSMRAVDQSVCVFFPLAFRYLLHDNHHGWLNDGHPNIQNIDVDR